jgi:general secretion pathway protein J
MSERGFSLLEVLVALTLTGVVLVVLFGGIGLGFRGLGSVERSAAELDVRRATGVVLRRELAAATSTVLFTGAPSAMSFVTLEGGPQRVWLALGEDSTLSLTRQRIEAGMPAGLDRTELAGNVEAFRLRYFGAMRYGDAPRWQDRWEGTRLLPQRVSLELRLAGDRGRLWPDEIMTLWAGGGLAP